MTALLASPYNHLHTRRERRRQLCHQPPGFSRVAQIVPGCHHHVGDVSAVLLRYFPFILFSNYSESESECKSSILKSFKFTCTITIWCVRDTSCPSVFYAFLCVPLCSTCSFTLPSFCKGVSLRCYILFHQGHSNEAPTVTVTYFFDVAVVISGV